MMRRAWLLLVLLTLSGTAYAHLLPKQNATMNIVDKAAFIVVSVPVSALKNVDSDGNGLLSVAEIQSNNQVIQQQFNARFHVSSNDERAAKAFTWVVPPQTAEETLDTDHLVIMHRANFLQVPENPAVVTDLFGSRPDEAQMTLTATRSQAGKKVSEITILNADAPTHTFFRGHWAVFTDYLRNGIFHILGGFDHLAFLLTIIVAAAGWRYWLTVVTCFTVAHSITLIVSALNIVRIPPDIVEPGIAASIIGMALINLRSRTTAGEGSNWRRIALVSACGLLHGFGFAGAIGPLSADSGSRLATLAGFNIGIEIGQFLFVGAALLIMQMFKRIGHGVMVAKFPVFASILAALFGLYWFIERLIA